MTQKPRRTLTDEQKAEAVRIVGQLGKPVSQVAQEMRLAESALRKWVKQAQIGRSSDTQGSLTAAERQELNALRRDLKRVRRSRDFFKKSRDLLSSGKLRSYELIQSEKVNFPIALMCPVLKQSRSGYYAWCNRLASPRSQENAILSHQIQQIYDAKKNRGQPRATTRLSVS